MNNISSWPFAADLGFSYIKCTVLNVAGLEDPSVVKDREFPAFPVFSWNGVIYYTLKSHDLNFYLNNRIYTEMTEVPLLLKDNPDNLPPYFRMDLNIK
ncbi:MAG: hypothetical protein MUC95_02060 [Spirochaetes bacterium]|nr:hypothetical protein [Spirochaetota bacterium]